MKRFLGSFIFGFFFFLAFTSATFANTTSVLLPISAGNYQQWTPKSGSNHVTMVDETTCNGTSDFNRETVVGQRDSYGISLSSIPDGSVITQVDITPCASRNSPGGLGSTFDVFYRLDGVDSADAGAYVLANTVTPVVLSTTSYASLSAVKSSGTTFEIGGVFSSGNRGVRLSQITTTITYTPLSTPSGLTASATGTGSAVSLAWVDNASIEDGFRIERSDNGGAFVEVATVSADVTTYNDPGLSVGTYAYRVRAYNSGGNSGYTATATAYILVGPYNLTAATTASGSSVVLNWSDGSANEDGFKIERSDNGGAYTVIQTTAPNVKTYTNFGLGEGNYTYRVRAYKSTSFSLYSNTEDAYVLNVPSDLIAVFASGSGVTLNWTDNSSNEDGFKIERRLIGGLFSQIDTVGAAVTSYLDPLFTSGNYEYRIRAYKLNDNSIYSATASAFIP